MCKPFQILQTLLLSLLLSVQLTLTGNVNLTCNITLYDQMYKYFNKILWKQQCGFRQGLSTQHGLLAMNEKWWKYLDKDGVNKQYQQIIYYTTF